MEEKTNEELSALIAKAISGDKESLETVILSVKDLVFNLSLRMLGTFADAEDAAQDIILKIITRLSSFRNQSAFSTWVFSIAVNHLNNYRKHMFAHYSLSFEYYGDDIENGQAQELPEMTREAEEALLAEELKLSCTNVMLQCLDTESRCIFVLGTMFKVDSRVAGDILGISPEAYRQRLSRIRKRMAGFLGEYCGEYGRGKCACRNRINYAVQNHRLDPERLDYTAAGKIPLQTMVDVKSAMEEVDGLSQSEVFREAYKAPESLKLFIRELLDSAQFSVIGNS